MTKLCKVCKTTNPNPLRKTCSYRCADKWLRSDEGIKATEKANKRVLAKMHRERKAEVKGLPHWLKKTQKVFNTYIRERDKGLGCISCGRHKHELNTQAIHGSVWDAGHYKSVGAHPELRFDPKNVNGQCRDCNGFKGGMPKEYAQGILKRFGKEHLDYLEGKHEAKHYTIEQLAEMRKEFSRLTREMKKGQ